MRAITTGWDSVASGGVLARKLDEARKLYVAQSPQVYG